MAKYGENNCIVDLGFVDGCIRGNAPSDSTFFDCILHVLEEMEDDAVSGKYASKKLIHNLGFVRGILWKAPMPGAYSDAMDRLMEYLVEGAVEWYQLPQPFTGREHEDPVLSDELRDEIYTEYSIEGRESAAEMAKAAGFDAEMIDRAVHPKVRKVFEPTVNTESGPEPSPEPGNIADPLVARAEPDATSIPEDELAAPVQDRSQCEMHSPEETTQSFAASSSSWTREHKRILREMKLSGKFSWKQIAERLGRTTSQCSGMWHWEKQKLELGAAAHSGDDGAVDVPPNEPEKIVAKAPVSQELEAEQPDLSSETPALSASIQPAPILTREDSIILDAEWPDIQRMLATGSSREKIAGDYDVTVGELNAFIDRKIREVRERIAGKGASKSPGEA